MNTNERYKAIEDGIDMVASCECRVDVGLRDAWTRCLAVISDKCRGPEDRQCDCSAHR